MCNNKDTEMSSGYESLSLEELNRAFDALFDAADDLSEEDTQKLLGVLAALDKKDPLPRKYTPEESWERFREAHAEELSRLGIRNTEEVKTTEPPGEAEGAGRPAEEKPARPLRYKKLIRAALIAAAVAVVLFAAAVTAEAFGFNLWGLVPKWTPETLGFEKSEAEEPAAEKPRSIPEALKAMGIEEPLYPTWIPERFALSEFAANNDPLLLYEAYCSGSDYLSISITERSWRTDTVSYQKDDTPYTEYISNKSIHYVYSDTSYSEATWNTCNYTVHIMGIASEEEMYEIINSVYR